MEESSEFLGDDCIYPSNFEEELFDVVSVEELLQAPQESNDFASCSTVRETYHISDYEEEIEDDEEQRGECEEIGGDASFTSFIGNTPNFIDEPILTSFADVPIDSFPKFVHFTNVSRDLMIKCLQGEFVPTFDQIRESDTSFRPLSHTHGRPINSNDSHHIIERWKKIQESMKVINIGDILGLSSLKDSKDRDIPSIETWSLIVQSSHVDTSGKHLTFRAIVSKIQKNRSMDTRVGGIFSTYVEKCLQTCEYLNAQLWD